MSNKFYKIGFWIFAIIFGVIMLSSYTYPSSSYTYTVKTVYCDGGQYVVAVSNGGNIAICPKVK